VVQDVRFGCRRFPVQSRRLRADQDVVAALRQAIRHSAECDLGTQQRPRGLQEGHHQDVEGQQDPGVRSVLVTGISPEGLRPALRRIHGSRNIRVFASQDFSERHCARLKREGCFRFEIVIVIRYVEFDRARFRGEHGRFSGSVDIWRILISADVERNASGRRGDTVHVSAIRGIFRGVRGVIRSVQDILQWPEGSPGVTGDRRDVEDRDDEAEDGCYQ